jgi:hypothetical protein
LNHIDHVSRATAGPLVGKWIDGEIVKISSVAKSIACRLDTMQGSKSLETCHSCLPIVVQARVVFLALEFKVDGCKLSEA